MSPIAKMPGTLVSNVAGVDRDQLVLQLEAPVRDRAELHGEAEERQHGIDLDARERRRHCP